MQAEPSDFIPPLSLAVSRLHRCNNLDQLRLAIFRTLPKALGADAVALYLLDPDYHPVSIFSWHTSQSMLREYERYRANDPLFNYILEHKTVNNYQYLIGKEIWSRNPIHDLARRYGLENVMEGPLIVHGRIVGTMRAGRTLEHLNFSPVIMQTLAFLCQEVAFVLERLCADLSFCTLKSERTCNQNSLSSDIMAAKVYFHSDMEKPADSVILPDELRTLDLPGQMQNVADRVVRGNTNKQIAKELGITENTVKYHVKQLFKYYRVSNRVELTRAIVP